MLFAKSMFKNEERELSLVKERTAIFNTLLQKKGSNVDFVCCPSCGYPTQDEEVSYQICSICNWQDDGQDDDEADLVWGGANKGLSLNDSRILFEKALIEYAIAAGGEVNRNYSEILEKFLEDNFLQKFKYKDLLKNASENFEAENRAEKQLKKRIHEKGIKS